MEDADLNLTPEVSNVPSILIYKKGYTKPVRIIVGGNLAALNEELPPL
jgi:hypothetical protein